MYKDKPLTLGMGSHVSNDGVVCKFPPLHKASLNPCKMFMYVSCCTVDVCQIFVDRVLITLEELVVAHGEVEKYSGLKCMMNNGGHAVIRCVAFWMMPLFAKNRSLMHMLL